LAIEEIGRNRNDAIFGQLIAHAAQPIGQTKNFLNDQHDWRFVLALWINDEGFNRAVADLISTIRRGAAKLFRRSLPKSCTPVRKAIVPRGKQT